MHHINTLTKINVKIDKCELPTFYWLPKLHKRPYKSRFISNSSHCSTTILSKHITSALTAVKDHVMNIAIVMSIIFGPLKTLPRSSKSCDCVTFRVLKYLLSTFLLYTPHCHMIWSKQKCCLWSTGVSTESQNLTSVLHLRQDFLATRHMTRIDVGLARSYVKLLLSSWKTYMCNLMAWYIIQLLTGDEGNIWYVGPEDKMTKDNILSEGPTYHMLPESPVNNCFVIPSLVKDNV